MPETNKTEWPLRFNLYGRFLIELRREGDVWIAYRLDGEWKIAAYPDDLFHEWAKPGDFVTRV